MRSVNGWFTGCDASSASPLNALRLYAHGSLAGSSCGYLRQSTAMVRSAIASKPCDARRARRVSLHAIRREFDVNVFGSLSVINAFLPALRRARGRIVQISTWTASMPMPFNGPSGASKAAIEVFATVYRAELKRFGVDVVIAVPGNMRTGGPAKTAAALARVSESMTPEQRTLYGKTFGAFTTALNDMQGAGLDSVSAARRVIELAEQVPAPSIAPVGPDTVDILRAVREKSDAEQDAIRLQVVGLGVTKPE